MWHLILFNYTLFIIACFSSTEFKDIYINIFPILSSQYHEVALTENVTSPTSPSELHDWVGV